jgi:transposase InsO family protein
LVLLRNDRAKDYKTKALKDFLRQEGIRHEVNGRYCPQSNGLAERLNLTITDKVRCVLIDAKLTPKLWPYAAHYAVLIYNNLPHSLRRVLMRSNITNPKTEYYYVTEVVYSVPMFGTFYMRSSYPETIR